MKTAAPIMIDLFCGRGGWSKPAIARGWHCIGYDLEDHGYPGKLRKIKLPCLTSEIMQHNPAFIAASPPCEDYARRHLPWIAAQGPIDERPLRWAIQLAAIVPCPMIVECNTFSGKEVHGGWLYRPYRFWGNVPLLLPTQRHIKDNARGHSSQPRQQRIAKAAEIPYALADWFIELAEIALKRTIVHPQETNPERQIQ